MGRRDRGACRQRECGWSWNARYGATPPTANHERTMSPCLCPSGRYWRRCRCWCSRCRPCVVLFCDRQIATRMTAPRERRPGNKGEFFECGAEACCDDLYLMRHGLFFVRDCPGQRCTLKRSFHYCDVLRGGTDAVGERFSVFCSERGRFYRLFPFSAKRREGTIRCWCSGDLVMMACKRRRPGGEKISV